MRAGVRGGNMVIQGRVLWWQWGDIGAGVRGGNRVRNTGTGVRGGNRVRGGCQGRQ